ncbi:MAG: hypothetical protein PHC95_03090, partial [Parabacteroides sp.]|nr:hypothetical protein [Parabacteroides sp.]
MRATTTIFLIILSLLASGKAWSQGEGSYSYSETEHFFIKRYTDSDFSTDYLTLKHEPPAQWVDGMNSGYYFQFNKAMTEQDFVGILRD